MINQDEYWRNVREKAPAITIFVGFDEISAADAALPDDVSHCAIAQAEGA